jgi:hypothetical protein
MSVGAEGLLPIVARLQDDRRQEAQQARTSAQALRRAIPRLLWFPANVIRRHPEHRAANLHDRAIQIGYSLTPSSFLPPTIAFFQLRLSGEERYSQRSQTPSDGEQPSASRSNVSTVSISGASIAKSQRRQTASKCNDTLNLYPSKVKGARSSLASLIVQRLRNGRPAFTIPMISMAELGLVLRACTAYGL